MYLKLDESKWYKHRYEWSDRSKGIGRVDVYEGQIEVAEDVAPVVHAHWEYVKSTNYEWDYPWMCSECGSCSQWETDYCKDCGAKMDEEQ